MFFLLFFNLLLIILIFEYFLIKIIIDVYYFFYTVFKIKNLKKYIKKETIYVYRIEKDQTGPFRNKEKNKEWKHMLKKLNDKYTIPHPLSDKKLKKPYLYLKYLKPNELNSYIYAFVSLQIFFEWFDSQDRKLLKDKGYNLNMYKIIKYIKGTNQIMFKRENSFFIKEINY
jgi:hypothetical protein